MLKKYANALLMRIHPDKLPRSSTLAIKRNQQFLQRHFISKIENNDNSELLKKYFTQQTVDIRVNYMHHHQTVIKSIDLSDFYRVGGIFNVPSMEATLQLNFNDASTVQILSQLYPVQVTVKLIDACERLGMNVPWTSDPQIVALLDDYTRLINTLNQTPQNDEHKNVKNSILKQHIIQEKQERAANVRQFAQRLRSDPALVRDTVTPTISNDEDLTDEKEDPRDDLDLEHMMDYYEQNSSATDNLHFDDSLTQAQQIYFMLKLYKFRYILEHSSWWHLKCMVTCSDERGLIQQSDDDQEFLMVPFDFRVADLISYLYLKLNKDDI